MTDAPVRTILVPVDFGEASARAVEAAGALARRWPARLRLLHAEAVEAPAYFTHEQVDALAAQLRQLQAQAERFLTRFGRQQTSADFTVLVESRTPTDAILDHAASADLVVMGTHGRRGPSRWWLGSVAERVLREIDRPLLVVHAADDPARLFDRVCISAEPPLSGDAARALAETLATPVGGTVIDRRGGAVSVDAAAPATLVVVAVPHRSDGAARSALGTARVRTDAGAVLFVPEAPRM
jgi:nucleotide-binding universal stress UspA family protein